MKTLHFCLAGLGLVLPIGVSQARVEADPAKNYVVTPGDGDWFICAASFSGDKAAQWAHDLAFELRSRYQLTAFVHNYANKQRKEYEADIEKRRQQYDKHVEWARMNHLPADKPAPLPKMRFEDQYVVLVGGFANVEEAHRFHEKFLKLDMPKSVPHDTVYRAALDPSGKHKANTLEKVEVNPFTTSLVVPNPTRGPVDNQRAREELAILKKLNADESYSLLKCKKQWTLAIKEFSGASVIQAQSAPGSFMDKLLGKSSGSLLDAGAKQAHELAHNLRERANLETYVLHTRYSSLLTVGSYDSQDDPRLVSDQRRLTNFKLSGTESNPLMQFFREPVVMQVPRP